MIDSMKAWHYKTIFCLHNRSANLYFENHDDALDVQRQLCTSAADYLEITPIILFCRRELPVDFADGWTPASL